jgi:hypothetical protein
VEIYVAAEQALRKNERQDETQFTGKMKDRMKLSLQENLKDRIKLSLQPKIGGFLSFKKT